MVLIDAIFINKGGGAVLLQYLIETILSRPDKDNFFFLLDPRFERPELLTDNYTVINNSLRERRKFYRQHGSDYHSVFCFANTPPPLKLGIPVFTYFHNQKITEAPGRRFTPKYFRDYLKYLLVKRYTANTGHYIVQTPHMATALTDAGLKDSAHCIILPFYDDRKYSGAEIPFSEKAKDEFVFVANPSPQKNHATLLDAWELLLEQGLTPKLHVTIDETGPQLISRIAALNKKGTRIENHMRTGPRLLYTRCGYLIFPSVTESFGLPLVEAADCGMKILAADLPYVYEVIAPSAVFDPYDKTDIANTVTRAMTEDLQMPEVMVRNKVEELIGLISFASRK